MVENTSVEDKLNEFYRVSWAIIEDLSLIDIPDDDYIRKTADTFVSAVRRSFDQLNSQGYDAARESLDEASAVIVTLCRYKDKHLPNMDSDLSIQCAQAYRALFDPDGVSHLRPSLLNQGYIERMEQAFKGQSVYLGPRKPVGTLMK